MSEKTKYWLVWFLVWKMIGITVYPIHAQPEQGSVGTKPLQEALNLYNKMEWGEETIGKFKKALEAELGVDKKAEAYWYLALIAHANDNFQEAEDYMYIRLQVVKPSYRSTPPELVYGTVEQIFKRALERVDTNPPIIQKLLYYPKRSKVMAIFMAVFQFLHILSTETEDIKRNKPIIIIAEATDDKPPVVKMELSFRLPDQSETVVDMKAKGENRWGGEILKAATKNPGEFEFRVAAQDGWGNSATQSKTVVILPGGHGVFYWIATSGAAISTGIFAGWLLSRGSPSEPPWPSASPSPPSLE